MDLRSVTETIGLIIDAVGVLGITFGIIYSSVNFVSNLSNRDAYPKFRESLGKVILLGLEFLIAGDIIRSVVVEPSVESVSVLALVALIRTILSIALQMEITGRWPWQRNTK